MELAFKPNTVLISKLLSEPFSLMPLNTALYSQQLVKVQLATLLFKAFLGMFLVICFLSQGERFKHTCFHLGLNFGIKKERKCIFLATQGMSGGSNFECHSVPPLLLRCHHSYLYGFFPIYHDHQNNNFDIVILLGNKITSIQILIIFTHTSINQRNNCLLYFHKSDFTSSI